MLPASLIRAFLPKETKEMLNALRGSRTLLLLVIGNLPSVLEAVSNVLSGSGHASAAENITKIATGVLSVLTVVARIIPEDKK